ncbi:CPXCG motif-containing cysteine-rich protein [Marinicella meishanensis]|uniref:CPXCG motif-containing cysteine-rich protein n=1 Tax=Marinicella meishanensis TaxID=2873263 RepID=UPI001CBB5A39|nr:CPXCG motif-containing cysteine-rich protein [Marinicella sp. NBU2979]
MQPGLATAQVQCPHCWESFTTTIDCSVDEQTYVEDCYVCCHPIVFQVNAAEGKLLSVITTAE